MMILRSARRRITSTPITVSAARSSSWAAPRYARACRVIGDALGRPRRVLLHTAAWLWVLGSIVAGLAWSLPSRDKQIDLGTFLVSARAALLGMDPYGQYMAILGAARAGDGTAPPNLNPPISLLLFAPLAMLDPLAAAWIWYLLSLGFLVGALLLLHRAHAEYAPLAVVWPLSVYAVWHTLYLGQVHALLALAVAGAWVALRGDRPGLAGALMGAACALKPPLLVWPALLALRGERRAPLWAAAVALCLTLAPLAIFGPRAFPDWNGRLDLRAGGVPLARAIPGAMSVWALATRLGAPIAGSLVSIALLCGLGWWAWRQRPDSTRLSAVALCAALLTSPLTWLGYVLLLLPIGYAYARRHAAVRVAAVLLTTPPLAALTVFVDTSLVPHPSSLTSGSVCAVVVLGLMTALVARADPPARTAAEDRARPR